MWMPLRCCRTYKVATISGENAVSHNPNPNRARNRLFSVETPEDRKH